MRSAAKQGGKRSGKRIPKIGNPNRRALKERNRYLCNQAIANERREAAAKQERLRLLLEQA